MGKEALFIIIEQEENLERLGEGQKKRRRRKIKEERKRNCKRRPKLDLLLPTQNPLDPFSPQSGEKKRKKKTGLQKSSVSTLLIPRDEAGNTSTFVGGHGRGHSDIDQSCKSPHRATRFLLGGGDAISYNEYDLCGTRLYRNTARVGQLRRDTQPF